MMLGSIAVGHGRKVKFFSLALCGMLLIPCYLYLYGPTLPSGHVTEVEISTTSLEAKQSQFWRNFVPLLAQWAPDCPSPKDNGGAGAIGFDANTPKDRPDLITNGDKILEPLQQAHDGFVHDIISSTSLKSAHVPGSSGIVSTAGSSYMPLIVFSIRVLRRTGSTLPVEVFVKDEDEYEKSICDEVLPSMNARCLILSDILADDRVEGGVQIAHYQLKIFAVLFSSFENIIWMDSDLFFLQDPRVLLTSEPYTSTGLVTWPDYWALTASPLYYNISRQELPDMASRASSETGVFLISRKKHFMTLLLAAYYNFFGPSHYFKLLSQGAPGEGDKETFIHAASALGEAFYTVSEKVTPIGHLKVSEDGISGSAMVQSDPRADFNLTSQGKWRVKDPDVAKPPPVFFIHAHYPKFNPAENVFGNHWETTPTMKPDGSDRRAWVAPESTIARFGFDAERSYWEEIKYVSCNYGDLFKSWKHKQGVCARVEEYWDNVFATPNEDDPKFTDD